MAPSAALTGALVGILAAAAFVTHTLIDIAFRFAGG
jgi:hypothetical protein